MKALSIKSPWIELIVSGQKFVETRTWKTNYRGKILLVSSKTIDTIAERHFRGGYDPTPYGYALAIAELVDCRPMIPSDARRGGALCEYLSGLFSWILRDVKPIKPFPVKG